MAFNQTRDVLDHVRGFHRSMSTFYAGLRDCAADERARDLLVYLSDHAASLDRWLAEYEEQVSGNVLDTYFKYESECTHESRISEYETKPVMDVRDITAAAMYFDTCLIAFCHEMAERAMSETVQEVFENMLEMERREQEQLSKNLLEMV
jgi:hypothetical protein